MFKPDCSVWVHLVSGKIVAPNARPSPPLTPNSLLGTARETAPGRVEDWALSERPLRNRLPPFTPSGNHQRAYRFRGVALIANKTIQDCVLDIGKLSTTTPQACRPSQHLYALGRIPRPVRSSIYMVRATLHRARNPEKDQNRLYENQQIRFSEK